MEAINDASKLIAQALIIAREWDCTMDDHANLVILLESALEKLSSAM
jgi:hypothetical protein